MIVTSLKDIAFSSQTAKDSIKYIFGAQRVRSGMAAIPQSMLMAKSRKKKKESSSNQYKNSDDKNQPLCYNNKMMNSIWGQYNMYSVHNIKAVQNDAEVMSNTPLQQMLQENQSEHGGIALSSAAQSNRRLSEYASKQLSKFEVAAFQNVYDYFGQGNA